MIPSCYPIIITSQDPAWTNGLGYLYEPFEDNESLYKYAVLYINAPTNISHHHTGYYLLMTTTLQNGRQHGLILTQADDDQFAYICPKIEDRQPTLLDAIKTIKQAIPIEILVTLKP